MMNSAASVISCILLLAVGVPAAAQQRLPATPRAVSHAIPEQLSYASATRHPRSGELTPEIEVPVEVVFAASLQAGRSPWRYPLTGAVVGAVAGAAWGSYVMATTDEYLAPPAYLVTVPLGAALGALLGVAANVIDPPR